MSEPSLFVFLSRLFLDSLLNPDQSTLILNAGLRTGFLLLLLLEVVNILGFFLDLLAEVFAHKVDLEASLPSLASQAPSLGPVTERLVGLAHADQLTQCLTLTCLQPEEVSCRLGLDFEN